MFEEATSLGKKLHGNEFEVHKPHLASRMAYRDNPPANTAEDYYRVVMYDEFLSHIISELEERFVRNTSHKIALGLLYLLPSECIKLSDRVVIPSDLDNAEVLMTITCLVHQCCPQNIVPVLENGNVRQAKHTREAPRQACRFISV